MNLDQIYKQVILDHAKNRRNHREMEFFSHKIYYKNPTCGDIMTMYAQITDDLVEDITFIGDGCFISMASSSIFTTIVKGKTIKEVNELNDMVDNMIKEGEIPDDDRLEDAISLGNIHALPARYYCALMPWKAFQKLLKSNNN